MDDVRFDTLTRALGALANRRTATRTLAAGAIGLSALLASDDADAKKKKKKGKKKKKKPGACKANQEKCGNACCNASETCIAGKCLGACQFVEVVTDTESRLLLVETCATTETIVVPNGFILDGNGNRIHMAGPVTGYQAESPGGSDVRAGLLIKNGIGSVKNVTIDQDALQCDSGRHSAVVIAGGKGTIDSVEIVVTKDNILCYHGIDAATAGTNDAINIRGVTVTGRHRSGIAISGPSSGAANAVVGEIRDCTIGPAIFGMLVRNARFGPSFPITGNTVNANRGIDVAVFPSDVLIDDNTITGLGGETNAFGVQFNANTKGFVSNSAISGFACGVSISEDADVTVSDNNTFSSNTTNVCNLCQSDGDCDDRSTSCQDGICRLVCPAGACPGCTGCVTNLQSEDNRPRVCANQITPVAPDTCATDADCTGNPDDVCVRVSTAPCTQSPCGICAAPINVCVQ